MSHLLCSEWWEHVLDEAVHALVPDQGVDLIAWAAAGKCAGR